MKIALLIHVHTNPEQVERLVSRLRHNEIDIYINVDAKVDINEFADQIKGVYYIKNRVEVRWGRFSQVQQILNSFEEIAASGVTYSHILFISGQDYPAKPMDEIVNFLKNNTDKSYIDYHQLGNDDWSNLMRKRYEYWFFLKENDIRNKKLVKKGLQMLGFKRKYPFPTVYYGSCWFCLNMDVVKYLLHFTEKHPDVVEFFRHSGCSDELYIQSVLLNSELKNTLINSIYRYFDWSEAGKSPKVLTIEDYPYILESGAWFARKLDMNKNEKLFDELDKKNSPSENEGE